MSRGVAIYEDALPDLEQRPLVGITRPGLKRTDPNRQWPCMTATEWKQWTSGSDLFRPTTPCAQCLPDFAEQARAKGVCFGTPSGHLALDEDNDELPAKPPPPQQVKEPLMAESTAVSKPTPNRSVEVAMQLPCGDCLHEPVCRIKSGLAKARVLPIVVPAMVDDFQIKLAGAIECRHHLTNEALERPQSLATGPNGADHVSTENQGTASSNGAHAQG